MRAVRSGVAAACLALLALSFAPGFRPREIRARLEAPRDPGFAFDPQFRPFLEAVARATPPNATVAVFAPAPTDAYLYRAAFELAPRRIVGRERAAEARYLAIYRRKTVTPPAGATALPGGFLLNR